MRSEKTWKKYFTELFLAEKANKSSDFGFLFSIHPKIWDYQEGQSVCLRSRASVNYFWFFFFTFSSLSSRRMHRPPRPLTPLPRFVGKHVCITIWFELFKARSVKLNQIRYQKFQSLVDSGRRGISRVTLEFALESVFVLCVSFQCAWIFASEGKII